MIPDLTTLGKNLLLRGLTGEKITFTRMEIGNGAAQEIGKAVGLINPLLSSDISKFTVEEDFVTLTAAFSNKDLFDGFHITEIGVYAADPDDSTKDILFALGNEDTSAADYLPSNTQRIFDIEQSILVFIGDVQNVTAAINSSMVYASAADLKAHIEDKTNPHKVTSDDVGLGNVPNVSTNDQTPTYEIAETLQELLSGEKLRIAFGKIKRAVKALIEHLVDYDNPHEVTIDDIGAAKKTHTHSTNDINSGILGIARGGTGASTASAALARLGAAPATLIYAICAVASEDELLEFLTREAIEANGTENRTYVFSVTAEGLSLPKGKWRIDALMHQGTAIYKLTGMYEYANTVLRCVYDGEELSPFEWENPPMEIETEYCTTERRFGKPVYTRLEQFTNIDGVDTSISCSDQTVFKFEAYGIGQDGRYFQLDSTSVFCSNGDVFIDSECDTVTVQIWYTK